MWYPEDSERTGVGQLRSGQRDLGKTRYEIHPPGPNRSETVVQLESPPNAQNGEVLDLTLEDGRVLQIQVRGVSPYCRVISDQPPMERRRPRIPPGMPKVTKEGRRRVDAGGVVFIAHPCPRCLAPEVLVTHRGVMSTTLFCVSCRHEWGEPPAVVAAATRTDRRSAARPDADDRRGVDRVEPPICTYCSTDANVQPTRRTAQEIYFVCSACEAMWALPRPGSRPGQSSPLLG
jgi:hypothetical protein